MSNTRRSRIDRRWAQMTLAAILFAMVAIPARAIQSNIHPDCVNNPNPILCTHMVYELVEELNSFNLAFVDPNPVEAASFYHPRAIAYSGGFGVFFIGRESILDDALVPLLANIQSISLGVQDFHFSVINPFTIVAYGRIPATGVHKDGTPITQAPLAQTLTWTRNDTFDPKRPFLIMSDQE
jgi:hypothetical protein